ncbi:MAG: zinc ribbon domain-containing protein [Dokdonella sp.]|uniref:FmdB family zinc ribbon protein n=1 Tax=Dokdonella sp. TaxID=2291710 RepID=UPI0025B94BD3|nr:zinc ribbon domain-containing protein [Dokdonella sp.]MBZ0223353.1 zinc ribbon domain-containing protein [Dokdonella sp.]MCC7256458.1 zinc ribbon domain-containing protein [Dokdonella sp.]
MPIYEYECDACKAVFERLQKLSDPDPEQCPQCGKKHVRRRLSAPAFRLAGSGWYETDFKKDGEAKHNLAGKDEPAKPAAEAAKTEAAPAKPESKPVASSDSTGA